MPGTWRYPANEEPTGIGYLHFSETGRAFQFVYNPRHPERRMPLRAYYSFESPSTLRIRLKPEGEGWICGYHLEGENLLLTNPKQSHTCSRVSPEEIPSWFQEALNQELSRG